MMSSLHDESGLPMANDLQGVKDDLAFLRGLADQDGHSRKSHGLMLIAVGVIFSLVNFQYWLIFSGLLDAPKPWRTWAWLVGAIALVAVLRLISRRFPRPEGAARRAMAAAWAAVGTAVIAAGGDSGLARGGFIFRAS